MPIRECRWGKTGGGEAVHQYILERGGGLTLKAITYGGRITNLMMPEGQGHPRDIVLGFERLDPYLRDPYHFGAICGRFANRIAGGRLSLGGVEYALPLNDPAGPNTLHGGPGGFAHVVWTAAVESTPDADIVRFSHESPHLAQGFPGNVRVTVTYTLRESELMIDYLAATDRLTPINLTTHMYLNLAGAGTGGVLDHRLMIHAAGYTPCDRFLVPTGEIASVAGTPLDFQVPRPIGWSVDRLPGGYDHNFVLKGAGLRPIARLEHAASGRAVDLLSDQPGLQVYTSGGFDGSLRGVGGCYPRFGGVALEPQHFPDSVHRPEFPSTMVEPAEPFRSTTMYRFSGL